MPRRPAKPCTHSGCPALVQPGTSRCPAHATHEKREQRERWKREDARRASSHARGYGVRWQRLRLIVLKREPLCRMCRADGRVKPANEVDHIDGNARNNVGSNLRPLCKPCHSARTLRDQVPRAR